MNSTDSEDEIIDTPPGVRCEQETSPGVVKFKVTSRNISDGTDEVMRLGMKNRAAALGLTKMRPVDGPHFFDMQGNRVDRNDVSKVAYGSITVQHTYTFHA